MSLPSLPPLPASWKSRVFGEQATCQDVDGSENIENFPDTERLAFIGDAIVYLGITNWLHERYPNHHNHSLRAKLTDILSKKPGEWAKLYKLPSYIVVTPASGPSKSKAHPISKGDLFRAYAGAVYLHNGGECGGGVITSDWIKQIMQSEERKDNKNGEDDSNSDNSAEDEITFTRSKDSDGISGMLNSLLIPPSNVPKQKSTPQVPANIPTSNTRNFLSFLNERAIQKKAALAWDDNPTGPDHAKTWTSKLIVEGKEFTGTGHNKKQARSAASELALKGLQWSSDAAVLDLADTDDAP